MTAFFAVFSDFGKSACRCRKAAAAAVGAAVMEFIMDITLVTASNSDEVHGTDNDKRTGCGINLLRAESVTRYRRGAKMTDLKEITCEKCKASIAKKIIRADKKEMTRLLKEERQRQKMGIGDEGIVDLGNTVAKITRAPEEKLKKTEPAAAPVVNEPEVREEETVKVEKQVHEPARTIPGTGVAIDDDLAAFAINVPKEEESAAPENNEVEDDFLAQFAIQKPQEDVEEVQSADSDEDDFLAQFAVPSVNHDDSLSEADEASDDDLSYEDEADGMDDIAFEQVPETTAPAEEKTDYNPEPVVDIRDEDDIMKMFSIDSQEIAEYGEDTADKASPYENDSSVIDIAEHEISAVETEEPVDEEEEEVDLSGNLEWDYVANQIFGFAGIDNIEPPQAQQENAAAQEEAKVPEIEDIVPPVLDDIAVREEVKAPELDEIVPPVLDDIAVREEAKAPELDEIVPPVLDDIAVREEAKAPALDEIVPPVLDDIAVREEAKAPELDEIAPPVLDDIAVPEYNEDYEPEEMLNEENKFEESRDDMSDYRYSTPIFADEIKKEAPVQPSAPVQNAAPVKPSAHVQPTAPVQPVAQAKQPVPETPQIITVPQFAGYDMNGQPIYTYVQMQMTGLDANGQPIFAPLQNPAVPVMPAPQAAPVQPAAPVQNVAPAAPVQNIAPVQQAAPVQPRVAYTVPTANISKIAVNPHSKPMPQSFVNALASSREIAKKNLIETQGLKANSPVLTSVEAVLSQMGDNTAAKQQQQEVVKKNAPVYEEYKAAPRMAAAAAPMKRPAAPEVDERFMTKAELKAKKKQDKIDAKFKKDMAKRGF